MDFSAAPAVVVEKEADGLSDEDYYRRHQCKFHKSAGAIAEPLIENGVYKGKNHEAVVKALQELPAFAFKVYEGDVIGEDEQQNQDEGRDKAEVVADTLRREG